MMRQTKRQRDTLTRIKHDLPVVCSGQSIGDSMPLSVSTEVYAKQLARYAIPLHESGTLVLNSRGYSTLQASKVQSEFLRRPARQKLALHGDVRLDAAVLESYRNLLWLQHDSGAHQQEEEVEAR